MKYCILPNPDLVTLKHSNVLPYDMSGDLKRLEVTTFAIKELFSFMQPLSLELSIECQDEYWSTSPNVTPHIPHYHMQNESEFPYIKIDPIYPVTSMIKRENITPEVIFDWVKNALEQPPCANPYKLTWTEISTDAFLARLPNTPEFSNCEQLMVGRYIFPLEYRSDGIWVAGPHQQQVGAFAPLFFKFFNNYGELTAEVFTSWSIWGHSGSPGMQLIRAAVSRLQEKGWEIDFPGFLEY